MKKTIQGAVTAHQEGRLEEAEHLYRSILKDNPNNLNAYNNLGVLLQSLNRFEEAIDCSKKAINLKPDYTEAHYNLGITLEKLNKFEEAEKIYRKALDLKPDYAEAYNNLGGVLLKLNKFEEAEKIYRKALDFKSDYAEAYNNLGNTLHKLSRFNEAILSYKKALEFKPDYVDVYNNLGNIQKKLNRTDEAIMSYKKALKIKPDYLEVKHMLAALMGETVNAPTAPREYVQNLFDEYASYFEDSLINKLEYKTPKIIADMIISKNLNISLGSILDLGCGTGLIGKEIRKFCKKLVGIDLSSLMLEQAKNKNIYDKLAHRDIVDYLSTEKLDFDYFISADVFIYVGDLNEVFRLIKSRNNSKGKFVFSTEHTDKDGFILEKTGRYSHSKMYIESLCKKFDYKLSYFEKINLRKDDKEFLEGGLYLIDF